MSDLTPLFPSEEDFGPPFPWRFHLALRCFITAAWSHCEPPSSAFAAACAAVPCSFTAATCADCNCYVGADNGKWKRDGATSVTWWSKYSLPAKPQNAYVSNKVEVATSNLDAATIITIEADATRTGEVTIDTNGVLEIATATTSTATSTASKTTASKTAL